MVSGSDFPSKTNPMTMGTYPEVADLRLEDGDFAVAQCAGSAPRGWEMSFTTIKDM